MKINNYDKLMVVMASTARLSELSKKAYKYILPYDKYSDEEHNEYILHVSSYLDEMLKRIYLPIFRDYEYELWKIDYKHKYDKDKHEDLVRFLNEKLKKDTNILGVQNIVSACCDMATNDRIRSDERFNEY
jgi:hypothetical protein